MLGNCTIPSFGTDAWGALQPGELYALVVTAVFTLDQDQPFNRLEQRQVVQAVPKTDAGGLPRVGGEELCENADGLTLVVLPVQAVEAASLRPSQPPAFDCVEKLPDATLARREKQRFVEVAPQYERGLCWRKTGGTPTFSGERSPIPCT